MSKAYLLAITLILGCAAAMVAGCGGSDSSPTGPTSSAGGTDVGGTDDADSGSPCPSGQVEKKADGQTVCITQPSVEGDAAVSDDGSGGSIDPPTSDAAVSDDASPDTAADECPDLDGQPCTGDDMDPCTWQAVEGAFCSFQCFVPDGRMPYSVEGVEGARIMAENCHITL